MDRTILVVDDDPTMRTLLRRVLTRAGYRVREAEDGVLALAQIAIERPVLVVADLMMPRMNGNELVTQLMHRLDPIPCILMSAFHNHPPVETVPFLAKPFGIGSLLDLVAETLTASNDSGRCVTGDPHGSSDIPGSCDPPDLSARS